MIMKLAIYFLAALGAIVVLRFFVQAFALACAFTIALVTAIAETAELNAAKSEVIQQ